jgi:diguanylate cyclase (GGDEF)-like protein/PAS domain S-box-containing protein
LVTFVAAEFGGRLRTVGNARRLPVDRRTKDARVGKRVARQQPLPPDSDQRLATLVSQRSAAEERAQQAEQEWKRTFEAVPDLVAILDTQRTIVRANRAMLEVFGAEIVGSRCFACFHGDDMPIACCPLTKLSLDGDEHHAEIYAEHLDKHFHVSVSALRGGDGKLTGCIHVARDITDRKRTEEALRESARLSQATIDALSASLCVLDETGRIIKVNKTWRDFAEANGLATGDLGEGASYLAVCDATTGPDAGTAAAFAAGIRAILRGERDDFSFEYPCHAPGEQRWFVGRVTCFSHDGPIRVVVVHTDVTQRVLSENALRIKESALASALDGVAMADLDGSLSYVNASFLRMWGYSSASDVLGRPAIRLWRDREAAAAAARELVSKQSWVGELVAERKDGTSFAAQVAATLVSSEAGEPICMMSSFADVTERRRAEELMQVRLRLLQYAESHTLNELLQMTLDEIGNLTGSPIGFYHFVEADQKTLSLQAWSTQTLERFCRAEGAGMHYGLDEAGVWVDCVRERRPVIHNDYAALPHRKGMPEGHAEVVRELVVPVSRGDRIVAILGVGNKTYDYVESDADLVSYLADIAWSIAERKRAEEALRESEERFRALITNQGEGTGIVDHEEVFRFANPAAEEIFGVAPGGLVGRNLHDFVESAARPLVEAQTERRRLGERSEFELPIRRIDGERRILLVTSTPRRNAAGAFKGTYSVFRDITERQRVEEALRQRGAQLEALREVSLGITGQLDLDALLRTITERAVTLFGTNAGELFLYRPDRGVLELAAVVGIGASSVGREVGPGEGVAGKVLETGRPFVGDQHSLLSEESGSGRSYRWGSALAAPIRWRDEVLGVLGLLSMKSQAFAADDANLLELFATQAAVAIGNARLYAEVERLAVLDELTKLSNRRGLLTVGVREVERSRRFGHPLSLLFLDLDHFKDVNDRFSHEAGDTVLREISRRIVAAVREIDIVARYGGEEFVVLLLETSAQGAHEVAERMRRTIEGTAVPTDRGPVRMTVSVGVAEFGPDAADLETMIRLADEAMYAAKNAGRNRVVVRGN